MAEVSVAKKKRTIALSQFTRAKNSLEEAINKEITVVTVKSRYGAFKKAWENVQECQYKYVNLLDDDLDTELAWIEPASKEFDEIEILADTYIQKTEADIE